MFLKKALRQISIRWRLTILFTLVFGSAMGLYGYATAEFLRKSLAKEFDDSLFNYAVDLTDQITLDPEGDLLLSPPQLDRAKIYPFYLGTALIQIRHKSGTVLSKEGNWGSLEIPYKSELERLTKGDEAVYTTLDDLSNLPLPESQSYRVIHFPIDNALPPHLILQVAVPMSILENQISNRRRAFQFGVPAVILFAVICSYFLASRAMRPINSMVSQVRNIGADELSKRLPVPVTEDELKILAVTLNQMLDRIERAFLSQEKFIADASHQLLTPLTIMKGVLEASGKSPLSLESTQSFLQEVDHLSVVVQNLLVLARMDTGTEAVTRARVAFHEIIFAALRRTDSLAKKKNIRIKFDLQGPHGNESEPPFVLGDEALLTTLVFNLIENALKYSDKDTVVELVLKWNKTHQQLTVLDSGPGIPLGLETEIFDRFRRVDQIGIMKTPGYGLGLSIAKKIADVHQGRLWAENRGLGTAGSSGSLFHFEINNG